VLNILLIALAALFVLIIVLFGFIAMQPATFQITRSTKINAPPATVFAQVNDFHNWNAWSPWAKLDPNAKNTFEGPESGKGAQFHWVGNNEVGEGGMTITESQPNELILLKLQFIKPFESTCDTEFKFQPDGDGTDVTWTMSGQNNFMSKAMHLVMDIDKMVGGQFEEGLASMKSIAEDQAKP
jgi:uncharacterized protein YndB with AHSA1/START domain